MQPVPRSRYSDDEKARALVCCRLHAPDYAAASKACEDEGIGTIPAATLRSWHQTGRGVHPDALQLSQPYARATAATFREAAARAVSGTTRLLDHLLARLDDVDETGAKIPAREALELAEKSARVAALMIDKAQLLDGQPSLIAETRNLSLVALLRGPSPPSTPDPDAEPEA